MTALKNMPKWLSITAIYKNRVYTNRKGLYWQCRKTTEEILPFL